MPRNVTASRRELTLTDNSTGEKFKMFYRKTSNPERMEFANSLYEKKGKRTVPKDNIFKEQVALGKKLCVGFSEGYFMDGAAFFSADKSKPYFREDWKELIEGDLPEAFQQIALVATRPVTPDDPAEEEPEAEADAGDQADSEAQAKAEEAPLGSSSEPS